MRPQKHLGPPHDHPQQQWPPQNTQNNQGPPLTQGPRRPTDHHNPYSQHPGFQGPPSHQYHDHYDPQNANQQYIPPPQQHQQGRYYQQPQSHPPPQQPMGRYFPDETPMMSQQRPQQQLPPPQQRVLPSHMNQQPQSVLQPMNYPQQPYYSAQQSPPTYIPPPQIIPQQVYHQGPPHLPGPPQQHYAPPQPVSQQYPLQHQPPSQPHHPPPYAQQHMGGPPPNQYPPHHPNRPMICPPGHQGPPPGQQGPLPGQQGPPPGQQGPPPGHMISMPPQNMHMQGLPPQSMPPQGMPPQHNMPPQGMPPQNMPQNMPPQSMHPQGPNFGPSAHSCRPQQQNNMQYDHPQQPLPRHGFPPQNQPHIQPQINQKTGNTGPNNTGPNNNFNNRGPINMNNNNRGPNNPNNMPNNNSSQQIMINKPDPDSKKRALPPDVLPLPSSNPTELTNDNTSSVVPIISSQTVPKSSAPAIPGVSLQQGPNIPHNTPVTLVPPPLPSAKSFSSSASGPPPIPMGTPTPSNQTKASTTPSSKITIENNNTSDISDNTTEKSSKSRKNDLKNLKITKSMKNIAPPPIPESSSLKQTKISKSSHVDITDSDLEIAIDGTMSDDEKAKQLVNQQPEKLVIERKKPGPKPGAKSAMLTETAHLPPTSTPDQTNALELANKKREEKKLQKQKQLQAARMSKRKRGASDSVASDSVHSGSDNDEYDENNQSGASGRYDSNSNRKKKSVIDNIRKKSQKKPTKSSDKKFETLDDIDTQKMEESDESDSDFSSLISPAPRTDEYHISTPDNSRRPIDITPAPLNTPSPYLVPPPPMSARVLKTDPAYRPDYIQKCQHTYIFTEDFGRLRVFPLEFTQVFDPTNTRAQGGGKQTWCVRCQRYVYDTGEGHWGMHNTFNAHCFGLKASQLNEFMHYYTINQLHIPPKLAELYQKTTAQGLKEQTLFYFLDPTFILSQACCKCRGAWSAPAIASQHSKKNHPQSADDMVSHNTAWIQQVLQHCSDGGIQLFCVTSDKSRASPGALLTASEWPADMNSFYTTGAIVDQETIKNASRVVTEMFAKTTRRVKPNDIDEFAFVVGISESESDDDFSSLLGPSAKSFEKIDKNKKSASQKNTKIIAQSSDEETPILTSTAVEKEKEKERKTPGRKPKNKPVEEETPKTNDGEKPRRKVGRPPGSQNQSNSSSTSSFISPPISSRSARRTTVNSIYAMSDAELARYLDTVGFDGTESAMSPRDANSNDINNKSTPVKSEASAAKTPRGFKTNSKSMGTTPKSITNKHENKNTMDISDDSLFDMSDDDSLSDLEMRKLAGESDSDQKSPTPRVNGRFVKKGTNVNQKQPTDEEENQDENENEDNVDEDEESDVPYSENYLIYPRDHSKQQCKICSALIYRSHLHSHEAKHNTFNEYFISRIINPNSGSTMTQQWSKKPKKFIFISKAKILDGFCCPRCKFANETRGQLDTHLMSHHGESISKLNIARQAFYDTRVEEFNKLVQLESNNGEFEIVLVPMSELRSFDRRLKTGEKLYNVTLKDFIYDHEADEESQGDEDDDGEDEDAEDEDAEHDEDSESDKDMPAELKSTLSQFNVPKPAKTGRWAGHVKKSDLIALEKAMKAKGLDPKSALAHLSGSSNNSSGSSRTKALQPSAEQDNTGDDGDEDDESDVSTEKEDESEERIPDGRMTSANQPYAPFYTKSIKSNHKQCTICSAHVPGSMKKLHPHWMGHVQFDKLFYTISAEEQHAGYMAMLKKHGNSQIGHKLKQLPIPHASGDPTLKTSWQTILIVAHKDYLYTCGCLECKMVWPARASCAVHNRIYHQRDTERGIDYNKFLLQTAVKCGLGTTPVTTTDNNSNDSNTTSPSPSPSNSFTSLKLEDLTVPPRGITVGSNTFTDKPIDVLKNFKLPSRFVTKIFSSDSKSTRFRQRVTFSDTEYYTALAKSYDPSNEASHIQEAIVSEDEEFIQTNYQRELFEQKPISTTSRAARRGGGNNILPTNIPGVLTTGGPRKRGQNALNLAATPLPTTEELRKFRDPSFIPLYAKYDSDTLTFNYDTMMHSACTDLIRPTEIDFDDDYLGLNTEFLGNSSRYNTESTNTADLTNIATIKHYLALHKSNILKYLKVRLPPRYTYQKLGYHLDPNIGLENDDRGLLFKKKSAKQLQQFGADTLFTPEQLLKRFKIHPIALTLLQTQYALFKNQPAPLHPPQQQQKQKQKLQTPLAPSAPPLGPSRNAARSKKVIKEDQSSNLNDLHLLQKTSGTGTDIVYLPQLPRDENGVEYNPNSFSIPPSHSSLPFYPPLQLSIQPPPIPHTSTFLQLTHSEPEIKTTPSPGLHETPSDLPNHNSPNTPPKTPYLGQFIQIKIYNEKKFPLTISRNLPTREPVLSLVNHFLSPSQLSLSQYPQIPPDDNTMSIINMAKNNVKYPTTQPVCTDDLQYREDQCTAPDECDEEFFDGADIHDKRYFFDFYDASTLMPPLQPTLPFPQFAKK